MHSASVGVCVWMRVCVYIWTTPTPPRSAQFRFPCPCVVVLLWWGVSGEKHSVRAERPALFFSLTNLCRSQPHIGALCCTYACITYVRSNVHKHVKSRLRRCEYAHTIGQTLFFVLCFLCRAVAFSLKHIPSHVHRICIACAHCTTCMDYAAHTFDCAALRLKCAFEMAGICTYKVMDIVMGMLDFLLLNFFWWLLTVALDTIYHWFYTLDYSYSTLDFHYEFLFVWNIRILNSLI